MSDEMDHVMYVTIEVLFLVPVSKCVLFNDRLQNIIFKSYTYLYS